MDKQTIKEVEKIINEQVALHKDVWINAILLRERIDKLKIKELKGGKSVR
jgi:alanyl-tRNA synthetase